MFPWWEYNGILLSDVHINIIFIGLFPLVSSKKLHANTIKMELVTKALLLQYNAHFTVLY